jgi:hypothetical protein
MIISGEAEEIIVGQPGEPLLELAELALSAARRRGREVTMMVGDAAVIVTGRETAGEIVAALAGRPARPAAPEDPAARAALALQQVRLCNHLAGMKAALDAGERSTVLWVAKLTRLAEDERVILPCDPICQALEARGYRPAPERPLAGVTGEPSAIARALIGHALGRMQRGRRPHPALGMLAERYDLARARDALH